MEATLEQVDGLEPVLLDENGGETVQVHDGAQERSRVRVGKLGAPPRELKKPYSPAGRVLVDQVALVDDAGRLDRPVRGAQQGDPGQPHQIRGGVGRVCLGGGDRHQCGQCVEFDV